MPTACPWCDLPIAADDATEAVAGFEYHEACFAELIATVDTDPETPFDLEVTAPFPFS